MRDCISLIKMMPARFTSGSWGFQIAPYLDQSPMFMSGRSSEPIWTYLCPARGRPTNSSTSSAGSGTPPWSDYLINPWLNDSQGGGGLTTNSAMPDVKRTLVSISDGTSNTIFFGHGQIKPAVRDFYLEDLRQQILAEQRRTAKIELMAVK